MPRFNSLSPARKLRRLIVREFKEKKTPWTKDMYCDEQKGAYCAIGGAAHALGIPDVNITRGIVGEKLGMSEVDTWADINGIIGRVIAANDSSKTKTEMLRKVKDICK